MRPRTLPILWFAVVLLVLVAAAGTSYADTETCEVAPISAEPARSATCAGPSALEAELEVPEESSLEPGFLLPETHSCLDAGTCCLVASDCEPFPGLQRVCATGGECGLRIGTCFYC